MMTMKEKPKVKRVKKAAAQPTPVTDDQHLEAIEILKEKCYELHFTISRLPTSRKLERKQAESVAKHLGGSRKGIRSSWTLFLDSHPHVAALNAALNALSLYRDGFAMLEDSKKAGGAAEQAEGAKKRSTQEGGKRLIWAQDHKDIYDQVVELADRVALAASAVQVAMPEIKANDRKEAGDAWNEAAYPADIAKIVGVPKDSQGRYIVDFAPTVAIPKNLDADIKEQIISRAMNKLSGSLELTVEGAVRKLNTGLATFMSELVNRVRIFPSKDHELHKYCVHGNPEVVKTKVSGQDASVPAGSVMLYIQYKALPEGADPAASTSDDLEMTKRWVGPYTEKEYQNDIRPQSTEERKKIYPTVIEGLISRMQDFREKQASLLGAHGKNVDGAFTSLFEHLNELRRLGDNNYKVGEKVANKLKLDSDYKAELAEAVADTIEALDNAVVETKKVRRRVNSKMLDD